MRQPVKFLLCSLLFLFGGVFLLTSQGQSVYAQWPDFVGNAATATLWVQQQPEVTLQQQLIVGMEYIVKLLYLFLWPLLAIAGASLDNSLVYGEIFYLDRSLWQFWQMMRTFANFLLWFLLVASILFSFFGAGSKKLALQSTIKNLFVAGILINMSRWIVAVLIDFSTVLTVNLGGLPIIAMNGDETSSAWVKTTQVKYLTMHAQFDMDSSNEATTDKADHTVVYSCFGKENSETVDPTTKKYYLPCWIENGVFIKWWVNDPVSPDPQTRYGYKAWFIKSRENIGNWTMLTKDSIDDQWCTYQYDLLLNCSVNVDSLCGDKRELTKETLEGLKAKWAKEMDAQGCSTLQDFLTKAKGMTWPLYNLYATILNMGQIALSSNHDSLVATWVNMFMKVIVGIALILPLFALAVVLIMRVVVLWVVIAFSPFLIVMYVFDYQVPGVGKKGSMGNILGLIFLPVFATFAISISALFLTLIWRIDLIQNNQEVDALQVLGADKVTCDGKGDAWSADCRCYKFFGMSICVDGSTRKTGANILNTLSWLVTNFFGIALMRSIIFFALKSNEITWSVAGKIGDRGKGILANTSMIPIPGMGMVSPGALQSAAKNIWRMPDRIADSSFTNSGLGKFVGNLENRMMGNKTTTPPVETDKKLEEKVKKNDVQADDMKNAVAARQKLCWLQANCSRTCLSCQSIWQDRVLHRR
jgi:hypothetical protein